MATICRLERELEAREIQIAADAMLAEREATQRGLSKCLDVRGG
jgi:hypothetical protein